MSQIWKPFVKWHFNLLFLEKTFHFNPIWLIVSTFVESFFPSFGFLWKSNHLICSNFASKIWAGISPFSRWQMGWLFSLILASQKTLCLGSDKINNSHAIIVRSCGWLCCRMRNQLVCWLACRSIFSWNSSLLKTVFFPQDIVLW